MKRRHLLVTLLAALPLSLIAKPVEADLEQLE